VCFDARQQLKVVLSVAKTIALRCFPATRFAGLHQKQLSTMGQLTKMTLRWLFLIAVVSVSGCHLSQIAQAHDAGVRISLPKRGKLTPVQRLNREGVQALRKNQFEKAETLFYKAYLFDPDDPFTLNNLGYVSELKGQIERARRFYDLAAQRETEATIDRASSSGAEGKSVKEAVNSIGDLPLQVNRANVEAIQLMSQGRASEADAVLQRALSMDVHNPYTLNNLGVVREMEGEFEDALKYYTAVADAHSADRVIVTLNGGWRGKPISEMAADSARKVRDRLSSDEGVEARIARLNLRGVSSINHNNWQDARQYFQQAYALDHQNAFSLNNLGYLAELDGDGETAQFFYEKARRAERANVRVGTATRRSAEGMKLFEVANDSDQKVDVKIAEEREAKRRRTGPIELKRRDGKPLGEQEGQQPPNSTNPQTQPQTTPSLGPPQPPIPQLAPTPQSTTPPPPPDTQPQ
jgi:Flp pilus assembly protein TadD